MINDIKKTKGEPVHEVSWLNIKNLITYKDIIPSISYLQHYPPQNKPVSLHVHSINGRQAQYVDKTKPGVNSIEIAKNARSHNNDFQDEEEWRIHTNTGDFFVEDYNGICLFNLVEYLKLSCPSIKNYCQLV